MELVTYRRIPKNKVSLARIAPTCSSFSGHGLKAPAAKPACTPAIPEAELAPRNGCLGEHGQRDLSPKAGA